MATQNRYLDGDDDIVEPQRLDWFDAVVITTSVLSKGTAFLHGVAAQIDFIARGHANYRRDHAEAFSDMLKDIEAL